MTSENAAVSRVRIGELSRRTGVSDHVLRAWERRYGLLDPVRTEGGYRLYSADDELRVRRMVDLLERGLSPAQAAEVARETPPDVAAPEQSAHSPVAPAGQLREWVWNALVSAVDELDEGAGQRAVDELLGGFTTETALRDVLLPFLREIGERWSRGELTVAQEHFASNLLRGRIAALARGWGGGSGPKALLACPPEERHDIALLACAVVLRRQGWRVTFLGADTPVDSLAQAVRAGGYDVVVMSAVRDDGFARITSDLAGLAASTRVCLAGPAATDEVLEAVGAERLEGDPVSAAMSLSRR